MIFVKEYYNSVLSSITYLLSVLDSRYVWMVDCGDIIDILQWLRQEDKDIQGILLTHTHFDHIYGLNELKKVYPACKVYTSSDGTKGLYDPKLNMSFYYDEIDNYVFQFDDVTELKEADKMELWLGVTMEVIESSGHDTSCLTYKIGRYLFTGDSYIPGIKVVTNFPKSNKKDADVSLKKILMLKERDNLVVCPGHVLR
ncbi:MAG: MBL fold metallo-hydrolase [Prevotella sp.]|jgi:glyoxylase-like metal-dependent hydrolase (beta-lactamase superfamily II)|nr:MBL fold metallo-hydrolase [Prevotella sp.]